MDLLDLHERAVNQFGDLIDLVRADQLALPTPCADWTVRGLLRHQVSQNLGFAAAARGERPGLAVWDSGELGGNPAGAYRESAAQVCAAFAEDGALRGNVYLIDLGGEFAAATAVVFHLVDCLVHRWDLAKSIGAPAEPDEELAGIAAELMARPFVRPDGQPVRRPFAPPVPVPQGASAGEALLARFGRDPNWSAG
ncbi:TIGR03086 family metal-binding protein [Kutzneria viridogrisea]|uniref:Mycothiol-dependent maleylpyruvate isomerase metal-binding domain-containing protein n=2 Tax=Kutzneria TaxID=43356 RepID=W5W745_9PSEU|nr:TIGR03086 family metal-binding protein [Kutzneria albida]AHH94034.1 hypothetical protein KALB_659 [Kutzneria albida DSM 43870]MBA8930960.1 uncharacterized protein (TIGR03086 family) [Kutzneria viridogrisea]